MRWVLLGSPSRAVSSFVRPSLAIAALLVAGCGESPPRVAPTLGTVAGVVVSNSPMFIDRPQPSLLGDRLSVTYSVLVQNVGQEHVELDLARAKVSVDGVEGSADCSARGYRVPVLSLMPSDRWRVDCRLTLTPESTQALRRAD